MDEKELDQIYEIFKKREKIKNKLDILTSDYNNYKECDELVKIYADFNGNDKHIIASGEDVRMVLSLLIEKNKDKLKEIEKILEVI